MSLKERVKALPPRVKVIGVTGASHEIVYSLPRIDVAPISFASAATSLVGPASVLVPESMMALVAVVADLPA